MKTYKNPISTAMSEYREDFRYNREWWTNRMGTGNNNEYLYIQFKNGDIIVIQSDYFQLDGNTCLPRFRADEVAYISRYYGDQCETTTANNIVVDTDRIILYRDGVEYFRYEMTEEEYKEMRRRIWELDESIDATAWMLDYCRALATSKMSNNQPEPTNPDNTPATMNANEITLTPEAAAAYNSMLTPTEEPADLAWESEPMTDDELTALGVEVFGGNDTTDETTAPEFSELSHAAQCLDIYLHNTREIYDRYTVPAIKKVAERARRCGARMNWGGIAKELTHTPGYNSPASLEYLVTNAVDKARRLVRQSDGLTPTAQDIEQVTRNYAAYIVDCAKYEIENA